MQQAQPLSLQPLREKIDSGDVTAGVAEAVDETERHWVTAHPEHDRSCRGGSFCGDCPIVAYRNEHGHPVLQQIGHQRWITIKVVLRRAELNRHILILDISGVLETGMKSCDLLAACLYTGNHESDHRHRRLLRSRGQRPCNYRAAEKPDEFPPPHGIYSPGREPPSCKSNTNLERRPCTASQHVKRAHVRFGSKADIGEGATDVRFTPKSGH